MGLILFFIIIIPAIIVGVIENFKLDVL